MTWHCDEQPGRLVLMMTNEHLFGFNKCRILGYQLVPGAAGI